MEANGEIAASVENAPGGYELKRTVANRSIKPGVLSEDETAALDRQIERFAQANASEIVAYSHRELGWRSTGAREPIPYEVSRFSAPEREPGLIEEAKRIADEESRRRAAL